MENQQHTQCPSCKSKNLSALHGFYPEMLLKCGGYGLIFDQRIPSQLTLSQHYATYSYSRRKTVSIGTQYSFTQLLKQFEPYRKTNNILDVGCGQGDFLIAAKQKGWNVYGSEYSPAAVKLCEDAGITMHQGEYSPQVFGEKEFDIVTSFEVLEHTYEPHSLLSASLANLRTNGLFYITTPNFNSLLRHLEKNQFRVLGYPEHLALYTPTSLKKLLSQYPLNQQKILTTGIDISRLKTAISPPKITTSEEIKFNPQENMRNNETIREALTNGKAKYIKVVINQLLTMVGKGDTLKAFYTKA